MRAALAWYAGRAASEAAEGDAPDELNGAALTLFAVLRPGRGREFLAFRTRGGRWGPGDMPAFRALRALWDPASTMGARPQELAPASWADPPRRKEPAQAPARGMRPTAATGFADVAEALRVLEESVADARTTGDASTLAARLR